MQRWDEIQCGSSRTGLFYYPEGPDKSARWTLLVLLEKPWLVVRVVFWISDTLVVLGDLGQTNVGDWFSQCAWGDGTCCGAKKDVFDTDLWAVEPRLRSARWARPPTSGLLMEKSAKSRCYFPWLILAPKPDTPAVILFVLTMRISFDESNDWGKSDQNSKWLNQLGKMVKKLLKYATIKVAIILAERAQQEQRSWHCVWHKLAWDCVIGFLVIQRSTTKRAAKLVSTLAGIVLSGRTITGMSMEGRTNGRWQSCHLVGSLCKVHDATLTKLCGPLMVGKVWSTLSYLGTG